MFVCFCLFVTSLLQVVLLYTSATLLLYPSTPLLLSGFLKLVHYNYFSTFGLLKLIPHDWFSMSVYLILVLHNYDYLPRFDCL